MAIYEKTDPNYGIEFHQRTGLYANGALNPDMQLSTLGDWTSATAVTTGDETVNKWICDFGVASATVQHISTAQPAGLDGTKSLKLVSTDSLSPASYLGLKQIFDSNIYNRYISDIVTVSAYIKSNNTYATVEITDNEGTSYSSDTHAGDNSWKRVAAQRTISSAPTFFEINFIIRDAGTNATITVNDYIEITGIVVTLGNMLIPFQPRHFGEELAITQVGLLRSEDTDPTIILEKVGTNAGIGKIVYNSTTATIDFIIE